MRSSICELLIQEGHRIKDEFCDVLQKKRVSEAPGVCRSSVQCSEHHLVADRAFRCLFQNSEYQFSKNTQSQKTRQLREDCQLSNTVYSSIRLQIAAYLQKFWAEDPQQNRESPVAAQARYSHRSSLCLTLRSNDNFGFERFQAAESQKIVLLFI